MVPDINLIPRVEQSRQGPKLIYFVLAILAFFILSLLAWQYFGARAEMARLQNEEARLSAQRDQLLLDVSMAQPANQGGLLQSLQFVETVSYPVSPLIKEIEALQPGNSYLRNFTFSPENVSIVVDFETLSDVAAYVNRLSNSAYFSDGQVLSITSSEPGEELGSENAVNFAVIPRQSVEITLLIDEHFLANGGVQ